MSIQTEDLKTLLAFLGPLAGIIGILVKSYLDSRKEKNKMEFLARQEGREFYRLLYGRIAVLHELILGYSRSLETGETKLFVKKRYRELKSEQILKEFREAYNEFSEFYIEKKHEGYELFVSRELKEYLTQLWLEAEGFNADPKLLESKDSIKGFDNLARKTTAIMEKLFGLE